MSIASTYPHLQADEHGNVRISGTRYKAMHLAAEHFHHGWTAEELLRQHTDLRPEHVYSVLTWFYDNYAAVISELNASLENIEQHRKSQTFSRDELLQRRLSAGK
jgi:uncharacterized protein (DUF433 family)